MLQKKPRVTDLKLIAYVRQLCCIVCGRSHPEAHHVTTRGAGGDDVPENLMPLCHQHHHEWHQSTSRMVEKYPSVQYWLEAAGRQDVLTRLWDRS